MWTSEPQEYTLQLLFLLMYAFDSVAYMKKNNLLMLIYLYNTLETQNIS